MRKPIKTTKKFKHKIVMLIDDNDLDNIINHKVIESVDFAEVVYTNTSAMSALEFLKNLEATSELSSHLLPDYIFVDLNMPMVDGMQFIELFYKQFKSISVKSKLVVLTSSINLNDKVRVNKLNPDIPFLNKPLTNESLIGLN
jgi:CheY-like chemotaxis protein